MPGSMEPTMTPMTVFIPTGHARSEDLLAGVTLGAGVRLADTPVTIGPRIFRKVRWQRWRGAGTDGRTSLAKVAPTSRRVLVGDCRAPGAHRKQHPTVGDEQADDHGDADADADQVARASQRQGRGGAARHRRRHRPGRPRDVDAGGPEALRNYRARRAMGRTMTQSTAGLLSPLRWVSPTRRTSAPAGRVGPRARAVAGWVGDAEDAAQDDDQDSLGG